VGWGKVILLGEHAVVYGRPAIAGALARGIEVAASESTAPPRLRIPAWSLDARVGDGSTVARALEAALTTAFQVDEPADLPALDLTAEPDLPLAAGLGSSAALAVGVVRAALRWAQRPLTDDHVSRAAFSAEQVFHGSPSGVDNELAAKGGIGLFRRGSALTPLAITAPITVAVGLSGQTRNTAERVAQVAALQARFPAVVEALFDAIGAAVDSGAAALAQGDLPRLGELLSLNHGLLTALGLSTPKIEQLRTLALEAGALGAKLTGAGGGGCVVALCPPNGVAPHAIIDRWRHHGFQGFVTLLGASPTRD
jgi:mevalonate kinase